MTGMLMSSEIDNLLARATGGDAEALGCLLTTFRNYLKLLAHDQIDRRLRGKVDPSDVVQDTFVYAHEAFPTFRGSSQREVIAWLRQILSSKLCDLFRHYGTQRRDVRLERQLDEEFDHTSQVMRGLAAPISSPSDQVSRQEQCVLVADALAELPEHYRQVIILRHMQDLTFPVIGQSMGRSEYSVKKLWVRALSKLRSTMEGTLDD